MTLTLVVGYASKDIGFLIADTLLTPEFALKGDEGPVNGKFHALKIQILNPDTAIAFSGDSATAFAIINRTGVLLNSAPESDVCTLLTEAQKEFGETQDCEFLVLRIAQDGKKLAHITNAGVLHCERTYIGDPAAYRTLMELTRPPTIPQTEIIQQPDGSFISRPYASNAGEIEFQRLSDAMELITNSNRRNTVGAIAGCVIRVADARRSKRLEYLQTVEVSNSSFEGQSGFSFLAANSGKRGVGLYYRAGKMGFVFIVGDPQPCHKEYAATLREFIEVTQKKYQIMLEGGTWEDNS